MKPIELAEWDAFEARRFLDEYWQRKPLLIRGWLKPAPLGLDQLARAAGDDELASRLVTGSFENLDWTLEYGPFDEEQLPPLDQPYQSLLVQDMDKKFSQVAELLEAFDFLPNWLLDDIMVSQAGPSGSVGPHVDAYDVFLVQAAGARQWELAGSFQPDLDKDFELAVLRNFKPNRAARSSPATSSTFRPGSLTTASHNRPARPGRSGFAHRLRRSCWPNWRPTWESTRPAFRD
jgi:ribosomal protein L16 Arg81 hydroxylase